MQHSRSNPFPVPFHAWALATGLAVAAVALAGLAPAPAAAYQAAPAPQFCLAIVDPQPSGVTDRPAVDFDTYPDYNFLHSSTHLQGEPALEKFAPGLFWNPPAPAELAGFQSVIVVDNTSQTATATVTVSFYDESGAFVGSGNLTIAPEGFATITAQALAAGTPAGRGSARIVSNQPIVGATIHHTGSVNLSGFGGPTITDPDPFTPGATSMQQLQSRQAGKSTLYFGPLPVSDQSPLDFLNGNAAFFWVQNPNPTPTTINVLVLSRLGINLGTTTVTLLPYETHLDLRLWNAVWPAYLTGAINYDDDFLVVVTADQPIVGEAVMTDFFSGALNLGGRFRMGSSMFSNSTPARVINPDFTYQPTNIGVQTIMGILNAGSADIGPVGIQYRNRNGAVIGNDTIGSLPRGAMARIGPGLPASPNYPLGATFDGSVWITGCKAGVTGWTMRTTGDEPDAVAQGFKKVWGEVLVGANGNEPGNGYSVTAGGSPWTRQLAPIVRTDASFYWPGTSQFLNHSVANIGIYWYRYFTAGGAGGGGGGPFQGLRFANTSFTYEDPLVSLFFATNLSEAVDITTGRIRGIDVIGDPIVEWGIFDPFNDPPIQTEVEPHIDTD